MFYDLAKHVGTEAIVIETISSEETSTKRMGERLIVTGKVAVPNKREHYIDQRKRWQDVSTDLEFPTNSHVSALRYNSEKNSFETIRVNDSVKKFVENIKKLLKNK